MIGCEESGRWKRPSAAEGGRAFWRLGLVPLTPSHSRSLIGARGAGPTLLPAGPGAAAQPSGGAHRRAGPGRGGQGGTGYGTWAASVRKPRLRVCLRSHLTKSQLLQVKTQTACTCDPQPQPAGQVSLYLTLQRPSQQSASFV